MRHLEDACCGCGALGGQCLHCQTEVVTCDGCGCEIDDTAYAFPEDPSDEDYCEACFLNRINDIAEEICEYTDGDACPVCDSPNVTLYKIGEFFFCDNCIHDLLYEFERRAT